MGAKSVVGALMALCAVAAGCSDPRDYLIPPPIPGEYALVAVGGSPLPATVIPPGGPRTYLRGTLTLGDDGTFVRATDIERCASGSCTTTTVTVRGTWTKLSGGSLRFVGDDGVTDPPPLVLGDGAGITFCAGPYGQPCQAEQVYERR